MGKHRARDYQLLPIAQPEMLEAMGLALKAARAAKSETVVVLADTMDRPVAVLLDIDRYNLLRAVCDTLEHQLSKCQPFANDEKAETYISLDEFLDATKEEERQAT
jgi:hypothetical protein